MLERVFSVMPPAAALACSAWAAGDLGEPVKTGTLWKLPESEVIRQYLAGEPYAPIDESSIRVRSQGRITFGGLQPREIELTWKDGRLGSILVMVYNKGDDGPLDKDSFEKKVSRTVKDLDELTGVPGKRKRVSRRESAVEVNAWEWVLPEETGGVLLLEASSASKKRSFTAEFIRLTMGGGREAVERGDAEDAVSRFDLKEHVRTENGAVWIDGIPMVDQGEKGYCVPAAVSRLFAYYGMDGVDQHDMAALCGSSGTQGTSSQAMYEGLKKIGARFHVRIDELDKTGDAYSWIKDYDKIAKRRKEKQLASYGPVSAWDLADPDILRSVRAGKPAQVEKWMKPIRQNIDRGIPVLWSVTLGVFRESVALPQSRGGHMRLIIGYNDENKTILFTDTWGKGHELKEMTAADACSMTHRRYVLRPTR